MIGSHRRFAGSAWCASGPGKIDSAIRDCSANDYETPMRFWALHIDFATSFTIAKKRRKKASPQSVEEMREDRLVKDIRY